MNNQENDMFKNQQMCIRDRYHIIASLFVKSIQRVANDVDSKMTYV